MFPAEGRDVGEEIIGNGRSEGTRMLDGTV